jgi:Protein of unknown function (DUF3108)
MAPCVTSRRRTLGKALVACISAMIGAGAGVAEAPVTMNAHYAVYMTHVHVGEITWAVYFSEQTYLASANGKASGVFSVLLKGEGSVTTHGEMTADGRLVPVQVITSITDDDGHDEVKMTFENRDLKHVQADGPPPKPDRVRVTPNLLRQVVDPLSAMLIPVDNDAFAHANCDKTLRIFDGRRRYNLALSYKRIEKMQIAHGYSGRVLVCGVVLRAIAGYDPDSLLVRYLAGKDDLELWFAPVTGRKIIAPVRALMPTLIGTLEIRATGFEPAGPKATHGAPPPQ